VVSGLRLVALSSIDYTDITFNVPESLVFSGLEPCLAVTLACVPLLQPLLGKFKGPVSGKKDKNFEQLGESPSECQLHPIGHNSDPEGEL
jgi:hypothetical protein